MMHAKSCHNIIPSTFRSPEKLIPVHQPASNTPRAISISASTTSSQETSGAKQVIVQDEEENEGTLAFWDYQFLFVSQRLETTDPVTLRVVEGAIPLDFPSGSYYLTGPGIFSDDYGSTVHPLDGHGYLRSFTFNKVTDANVTASFMAKYVKTEAQVEEYDHVTDKWRFTHRGPFSVLKKGKKLGNTKVMKNVANTSVLRWGGKLLCLWEGGDPYEIEPRSLDTISKLDIMANGSDLSTDGQTVHRDGDLLDLAARFIKPILYGIFKMPPKRMLSHYKVDAQKSRLLTVSCNAEDMLLARSHFTFYEHDSDFKLLQKREFNISDHLMIHDWAFTDTHYILFANRIKLDVIGSMSAVCGVSPMITALAVNPDKQSSPVYLLPRFENADIGKRDWRVPVEFDSQFWVQHVGNAFEVKHANGNLDIQIQAAASSYKWFDFQKLFGYNWRNGKLDPSTMNDNKQGETRFLPHLIGVSISLDGDGTCQKSCVQPLNQWSKSSDFPAINQSFSGSKNRYIYAGTTSGTRKSLKSFPFDTVIKLDMVNNSTHTWFSSSRKFIGEPIFVPKGDEGEDDGYILVVEYAVAIQKCYLVILDAKRIGEVSDLVARLEVPKHLNFPLGFHGFWASEN